MRVYYTYIKFALLVVISVNLVQSQEAIQTSPISKIAYAEKIYLQLSSNIYTSDQTVWVKAIVTDANQNPTQLSGVLHIDLIDFDERLIEQKLLKIEAGIADGFFQLREEMPSGRYLIRAYTEWNKNFNDDFIAKQYIDIHNLQKNIEAKEEAIRNIVLTQTETNQFEISGKVYPRVLNPKYRGKLMLRLDMYEQQDSIEIKKNKEGHYSFNYLLPKNVAKVSVSFQPDSLKLRNNNLEFLNTYRKTIAVDTTYLDIQFFPEGGKLVDGLVSKVAFKALNYKNEGKVVFGNIKDQYDSIIAPFKSNALGMGITYIKADKEKVYYGEVVRDGNIQFKVQLPKVHNKGLVFTARQNKKVMHASMRSNDSNKDSLFLKVHSRGVLYYDLALNLNDSFAQVYIDKEFLPHGIIKFKLFDKDRLPICERLMFNHSEDDLLSIKAETHLKSYSQRDKTNIKLSTWQKNYRAVRANLSVLVLNKEQLGKMNSKKQNILSYFLLGSELKGIIEKPSSYFDVNNKSRYQDIEALLLTQGWSNYIYNDINGTKHFKIAPEQTLSITGSVGEFLNRTKRPKKPLELTCMTFGDPKQLLTQEVDSTGRFNFNIDDCYGDEVGILIQSKVKDKKKAYTINIDKKYLPKVSFNKQEQIWLADSTNSYVQKNIERKQVEGNFKLADGTVVLDEIELSGYKLTPEREKMMKLHGPPNVVIEDKELHRKVKKWSYGLFSVLMFSYPEDVSIRRVGPNGGFLMANVHGADFTFIIIDGKPVHIRDYQLIGSLPTEEIKSVEIIKNPKNPRKYVYEVFDTQAALSGPLTISFINIYTYYKKGLLGVQRTKGMSKNTIKGFAPKREFYAPKYDDISYEDWNIPDLRSVVYWTPTLTSNENGEAEVEFYNADHVGEMLVIVEAISPNGKLGYYETSYKVEKKLEK